MTRLPILLATVAALSACGPRTQDQAEPRREAQRVNAMDTAALWRVQAATSDRLELARVEAELGSRGEFAAGPARLGRRTAQAAGRARWRRPNQDDPALDGVDCRDFLNAASAQVEFLGSGGPRIDRHRLDEDGDGLACGWADDLRRAAGRRPVRGIRG